MGGMMALEMATGTANKGRFLQGLVHTAPVEVHDWDDVRSYMPSWLACLHVGGVLECHEGVWLLKRNQPLDDAGG